MNLKIAFIVFLFPLLLSFESKAQDTIGYRLNVDLNIGESSDVTLYDGTTAHITLLDVQYKKDRIRLAVREARLKVSVDGEEKWIVAGNYNLPVHFKHVKIDCPIAREYLKNGNFPDGMWALSKEVRLRVWPVDKPVCPPGFFAFPINEKLFTGNTNFGLEPVTIDHDAQKPNPDHKIYYHWGADIVGVKAVTEVLAAGDGTVIAVGDDYDKDDEFFKDPNNPQPRFERIFVRMPNGWVYRYSHLNSFNVTLGQKVKGGDVVGILGNHWSDYAHMHFEMWSRKDNGDYILELAYPYLIESYIQEHHPKIMAVARPHRYIAVGDSAVLDGSKSFSLEGNIVRYEWTFHDSTTFVGPRVTKKYDKPGYYSEMLKVIDDHGNVEYDFTQVLVVYDNQPDRWYGYTTVAYYPTFNVEPGQELIFKGRYFNVNEGEDHWDFGDGSPIEITHSDPNGYHETGYAELHHTYTKRGHYIVTFSRTANDGTPAVTQLSIFVGEPEKEWVHAPVITRQGSSPFKLISGNIMDTARGVQTLRYSLKKPGEISFMLVDMQGRTVHQWEGKNQPAGEHNLSFQHVQCNTGVYELVAVIDNIAYSEKILIK